MKVAIVHEWLVDYSGSERVVEQILEIFPNADLYALVDFLPDELRFFVKNKVARTSFIQKLPFARRAYRSYLPLMPLAIEQLDLAEYDLVISSNHAVSKGVLVSADQLHITYCHSPIRYAWDLYHQYLRESGLNKGIKSLLAKPILHYIRNWDVGTANRVDFFVANSRFIARRIKRVYNRESEVIYPPVNTHDFNVREEKSDYYVTASRFVPYKKVDLIVEAFATMPDKRLVVIGDGPDFKRVTKQSFRNIEFLGYQNFDVLRQHMQAAKGFVFAAIEDFGITPVEAMACGTPVIALAKGGALETVVEGKTGVFFHHQTPASLIAAVEKFEQSPKFDPHQIRRHAETFGKERFKKEFEQIVMTKFYQHQKLKEKCGE